MIDTVLLNGLWQGALIVGVAMLVVTFVPKRDAATRYTIWFLALLALAIVPVLSLWHPQSAALPGPVQVTAAAPVVVTAKAASVSGPWLSWLWLAGVAAGFARLGTSYARIVRIVREATPAPEIGHDVIVSEKLAFPIATGMWFPRIVIPAQLAATMERADIEAILQHERAHVARRDVAGNMIAKLIEALLFFNPWTYVIGRQLINEREAACDDSVVESMHDAERYAHCLARLAQAPRLASAPILTPSAIGSRQLLVARIERLMSAGPARTNLNRAAIVAGALAFVALGATLIVSNTQK